MRFQGRLTSWDDAKGIGSITWHGSSDKLFVHISAFVDRRKRPAVGDIVVYEAEKDDKGRFRAKNVSYPASQMPPKSPVRPTSRTPTEWLAWVSLLGLTGALVTARIPSTVGCVYAVASLITFVAYCLDKGAAQSRAWRTPESTLHLMALCCGWPGAFAAQLLLHHKNRKPSFQIVFVVTILLNLLAVGLYV